MVKKSNGDVKVIDLQPKKAKREKASVNPILNAVTSFFQWQRQVETNELVKNRLEQIIHSLKETN